MPYKIQTTNVPEDSKDLVEVDAAEFIDLQRMGFIRAGKGDVGDDGTLKKAVAKDAPDEVKFATPTGPIATVTPNA